MSSTSAAKGVARQLSTSGAAARRYTPWLIPCLMIGCAAFVGGFVGGLQMGRSRGAASDPSPHAARRQPWNAPPSACPVYKRSVERAYDVAPVSAKRGDRPAEQPFDDPTGRPVGGAVNKEGGGDGGDAEMSSLSYAQCLNATTARYERYFAESERGNRLLKTHGPLAIACFSRLWVPPVHGTGGMQFHALHLYSQFAALGHTVHVFVTAEPDSSHPPLKYAVDPQTLALTAWTSTDEKQAVPLTLHRVPSKSNTEYSEIWFENCLEAVRKVNASLRIRDRDGASVTAPRGFDVVHSESWAGVPNAYLMGLPMLVTWHGSMLDWFRNEINHIVHNYRIKGKMTSTSNADRMKQLGGSVAFEAYMLLTVPHHVCISDSAADDLRALNLIEPERIHLIYNGVNPTHFHPAESATARSEFLRSVDASINAEGDYVVGCGGRLESIKGHQQLALAMERFLPDNPRAVLLVAGSGGEASRYEALKRKGLRVFLLGMLKQERLARFYQSLDVFVDPFYQHHGLNTVMLEAALSVTAMITTRLASAKTTVPCSAYGRTFGLGLVDELVFQLKDLQDHPEVRRALGRNARDRAVKSYGSDVMAGAYQAVLYDAALNPRPLTPVTGKLVCRHAYPAMCYREPS